MLAEVSSEEVVPGRTILLVEQDADRSVFLGEVLTAAARGCSPPSIEGTCNAEEVRKAFETGGYDLVVVDLDGGGSGVPDHANCAAESAPSEAETSLELLRQVKRRSERTPVIALIDPKSDPELGLEALRSGADDVVEKSEALAVRLQRSILACTRRREVMEGLERRVQDLELFTRTAAHDIQGPLRTMNLVVEMLVQGDDGRLRQDQVECLLAVRNQVHKLDVLSDGLLQLATLGRECLRLKPVPIDDVVSEVCDLVGSRCDDYLHYGPMPTVMADRTLLVSLLQNLVDNGLKYVKNRRPDVWIDASREGDFVRVNVTDNGIGIPSHQWKSVFLPFVRGAAVSETPGHGLGLAMCRRITELHNGSIWIENSGEEGTTVSFTLPIG